MDKRITLVLVAVLLALGGYVWYAYLRPDAPPPAGTATPQPTPLALVKLADTQVTAVEVQDVKNNQTVRVVRAGDHWNMQQPAQGPADSDRVDEFVYESTNLSAERAVNNPGDPASYGLQPPQFTVTLEMQDGSKLQLEIGNPNPDKSYAYMRKVNDPAIYLVASSTADVLRELVTKPPFTPTPAPTEPPTPAAGAPAASTPAATPAP